MEIMEKDIQNYSPTVMLHWTPVAKVPGEWNFINPRKKGFKKINVKSAEPIGPKFFVGHLGTPGKVYEKSKFQIFENFENPRNFL